MAGWSLLGAAIATHVLYKKFEPKSPILLGFVIFFEPAILAFLTVDLSLRGLIKAFLVFHTALVGSIVAYRLSPFHPLAGFPGPTINKITQFWSVYIQSTGKQHLANKALHDKYGPIVRVGPNELSIIDVDIGLATLSSNGLPKGRYYDARRDPKAPGNVLALVGERHTERRRLWNRGFTSESLGDHEVALRKRVEGLLTALDEARQQNGGEVDLSLWFSWFSLDFMGDLCFGGGFELMKNGADVNAMRAMLDSFAVGLAILCHISWASPILLKLPFLTKHITNFRRLALQHSSRRVQKPSVVKDLWYHLADEAGLEPTPPPRANVISDGALAMVAGSDTTATGVSSLFFLLLSHPSKYSKLKAEIDSVYPRDEDDSVVLNSSRHGQLTYLNACLNEALRLLPPALTSGPREVLRGSGGALLAGRHFPEGTQIYVPPYSMHRNPQYFAPHTDEFVPERWLGAENDFLHNTRAFIPFSYGPANCAGRALARREMIMLTAAIIRRFDVSLTKGYKAKGADPIRMDGLSQWEQDLCDYYVSTMGPLPVVLEPRF